jgi:hypothetical protein
MRDELVLKVGSDRLPVSDAEKPRLIVGTLQSGKFRRFRNERIQGQASPSFSHFSDCVRGIVMAGSE